MEDTLISVCIPAYNNADYIGETIESILNQSYTNIELVIVDDNSKDNTLDVITKYADKDKRVRIYHNDNNLGMSGNWNKCLELCEGQYIKLVCADDLLFHDTLEREAEVLDKNPDVVFVCSNTQAVDLNGKKKGFYSRYPKSGAVDGKIIARKGFFVKNYFGAPQAVTFRKAVYEKIGGFDSHYTYILDYDFFVRLALEGKVYNILEPLNQFRVRGNSNTGQVMGGDKVKTKAYVDEHRYLLEKNRVALKLSDSDIKRSVLIRKLRCFAVSVYLKIFVR